MVEQLGSGVQRILKIYDKNIFKFSPNLLKVCFPIKNVGENVGGNVGEKTIKLNKTQKNILSLINQIKYITKAEISIKLNKTTRTIERNMKKLQEENIIVRVGSDVAGYWKMGIVGARHLT